MSVFETKFMSFQIGLVIISLNIKYNYAYLLECHENYWVIAVQCLENTALEEKRFIYSFNAPDQHGKLYK